MSRVVADVAFMPENPSGAGVRLRKGGADQEMSMVPGFENEAGRPLHSVFIDNCAWDVFFKAGLNLRQELSPDVFSL